MTSRFADAVRAATAGDVLELERLVQLSPQLLVERDGAGHTLLGIACKLVTADIALPPRRGTPEQHVVVQRLLAAGADPDLAAQGGWAPLHTAAMTGHVELVQWLLAAGASRRGRLLDAEGGSPLSLALFYGQVHSAEALADPPEPDSLRTAAALGRPLARFINDNTLSAQAAEGADFYRPLLVFPTWQRTCSRQELLDEALSWAARNGRISSLEELVALGADVNANPYRGTPLLWAVYADRVDAARWLLDHGADPNLAHDFGGAQHGLGAVPLHLAAQYSCLKCLELLLQRGADPTLRDRAYDATPLGWAEHSGASDAIALLQRYC